MQLDVAIEAADVTFSGYPDRLPHRQGAPPVIVNPPLPPRRPFSRGETAGRQKRGVTPGILSGCREAILNAALLPAAPLRVVRPEHCHYRGQFFGGGGIVLGDLIHLQHGPIDLVDAL